MSRDIIKSTKKKYKKENNNNRNNDDGYIYSEKKRESHREGTDAQCGKVELHR